MASKHAKAVSKFHRKQAQRKSKTGQLPSPELDINFDDYVSFTRHLHSSTRILALLGAGLSAASGIPTFRGKGGFWRQHDVLRLATPEAFHKDPILLWQFYEERRRSALDASPNRAHYALAGLGKRKPGFLAVTQNIDGLSERAGHAEGNLVKIHGSLHRVKCSGKECDFRAAMEQYAPAPEIWKAAESERLDISKLPQCPKCQALLRPAVVWFGEPVDESARDRIHDWLDEVPKVDLMLVVGTTAVVYPAAAYIHAARVQGARIAVFNTDPPSEEDQDNPVTRLRDEDWFFQGDAASIVPEVLKETIGTIKDKYEPTLSH